MIRTTAAVLVSSALVASTLFAQVPPRDQPPAHVEAAMREAQLMAEIAAEGLTVERAVKLAMYQENRGVPAEAEATLRDAKKLFPNDRALIMALARHHVRQGHSAQGMEILEELAQLHPGDLTVHHMIATHYEELVRKGTGLADDEKRAYILKGIAAADRAIALDPMYSDALAYKNILLRHQMRLEPDPNRRQLLSDEADRLRSHAIELQKERRSQPAPVVVGGAVIPPPPPPPPPPTRPPCDRSTVATTQAPVRVGGNIRAPTKTRDVRPVYPTDAQAAKIQGVVIIEATIDETGRVVQACVLRSVPMLDDPALDAVAQWEFTPTLLNGAPVPVIMTVTVNFTLQ